MSKTRICFLNLTAIFVFACFGAKSQSTQVDLKKAIEMALTSNYGLKAEKMNIVAAGYKTKSLKADFLPQINYSAKAEYNVAIASQMIPGSMVGQPAKEFVPVQFGTRYNMGGGIEVTQNLIRKDLRLRINAAELNTSISQTQYFLSQEDLVYKVATAFYGLQTTSERISTTTKDYQNIKAIEEIAKAQSENGTLKAIDHQALRINAANKQAQLRQLQSTYNEQLTYFKYLIGISPTDELIVSTNIFRSSHVNVGSDSLSLQRRDIHLYHQLIESKETEIKSIRGESRPTLSSYFRYNYQSQFNKPGYAFDKDYRFKSSTIGISTTIPIFDGNRRKYRINMAQSQLDQLKFQSEQQQRLAKTELVTAWETLQNDQQQFQITQENLVLAEKVFTTRKALYIEGVTTLIELLDAEREFSESQNLYTQALINVQSSLMNVYKAKGTLLTEFLQLL